MRKTKMIAVFMCIVMMFVITPFSILQATAEGIRKIDLGQEEIEKENINNPITIKRFEFYKRLGFNKIGSEYLLYDVLYTPIININKNIDKRNMDIIFFDYYKTNCGELDVKTKCKIIK